ncbi:alkaline phosphatase family protein [Paludibaculum fermentans]|uniref:Alkaline phosphatase family protein n=1 Tax=Paludibaculum fermentans TaxID=1473598 RepID=A0A7S7NWS3_PALFE|nr:ectonucleotide pyrophosphatase/phosphodiesterase [Paludibaculum fermentans]QOY91197.1 alkaline phosphatase family protein [Paludibaculum fermentans]
MRLLLLVPLFFAALPAAAQPRRVLVVSVDGLDQRYLDDADRLGLRIPNLRRVLKEGQWSRGVVGQAPTVTWPSHTTLISGVGPDIHGILGNRRPKSEGGEYYWSASLLHARTLLDAVKAAGRTSATITWPVTVDAPVTWNLPEYFQRRRGGDMDVRSIESKCVPADLVKSIAAVYPAFPREWMEDRNRTMAALYLLKTVQPDLILLHLVDLDSEAHQTGPFTREANATLENIDEYIGQLLSALPKGYTFVLVSDHGFEKVEEEINLSVAAKARGVEGVRAMGGYVIASTPAAADLLRELKSTGKYGLGREIPKEEFAVYAPGQAKAVAAFESAPGVFFAAGEATEVHSKPHEAGNHGHWPTRYRAVYAAWQPGIQAARLPEISQKDIAGRLASLLGLEFTPGPR